MYKSKLDNQQFEALMKGKNFKDVDSNIIQGVITFTFNNGFLEFNVDNLEIAFFAYEGCSVEDELIKSGFYKRVGQEVVAIDA